VGENIPHKRQDTERIINAMAQRKQYDSRFKAKVAIEAIKNQQTIAQIASDYGVHPNQVSQWKKQVLEEVPQIFTQGRKQSSSDNEQLVAELYRQIGQLKVERDWLQKKTELLG
jgi:transposase-like protein